MNPLSLISWLLLLALATLGSVIFWQWKRWKSRRQRLLRHLAAAFDRCLEMQTGMRRRWLSALRQPWYLRGRLLGKIFEIYEIQRQQYGIISRGKMLRLCEPDLSDETSLRFELRRRHCWDRWNPFLRQRFKFGNELLDRRVILRCNDVIFAQQWRQFEELRRATFQAWGMGKIPGRFIFRRGSLYYWESGRLQSEAAVNRLREMLLLGNDLADLIRSRRWSKRGALFEKNADAVEKNQQAQRRHKDSR